MKFRSSSRVRFVNTCGGASRAIQGFVRSWRFGTSLNCSTTSVTHTPKSSVQLGAKSKFGRPSQQVGFSSGGAVRATTSSRSSPCISSQTSRAFASMKCLFFLARAAQHTQSSSVQCYFGPPQNPAPNPSIVRADQDLSHPADRIVSQGGS